MSFEEIVQKTVNAKAKAGLKSNIMVQDSDIRYPRGHCFSNNIIAKVQTQKTTVKNSRLEESKTKDSKTALLRTNVAEFLEQGKKDKKKKIRKRKRDHIRKWKKILTTSNNTINTSKKNSKNKYDVSKVIY